VAMTFDEAKAELKALYSQQVKEVELCRVLL
jgi:hypothetical protein